MPRALAVLVLLLLAAEPSPACPSHQLPPAPDGSAGHPRHVGHLVLIGGGDRPADLVRRIVALAGGPDARLLVVPAAHPEPAAVGPALATELERAGAGRAEVLTLETGASAGWESRQRVAQASGIFFAGGDAGRLVTALRDAELVDAVGELYRRGGVIAGTSAGATALGALMILGPAGPDRDPDRAVPSVRAGSLSVAPGLGLVPGTIVDQHFLTRRRHNRLLTALLESPELLGIGIDEATAIVVGPPGRFEVVGDGLVVVYDASGAGDVTSDPRGNLAASGVTLHLLRAGQVFDLESRRLRP